MEWATGDGGRDAAVSGVSQWIRRGAGRVVVVAGSRLNSGSRPQTRPAEPPQHSQWRRQSGDIPASTSSSRCCSFHEDSQRQPSACHAALVALHEGGWLSHTVTLATDGLLLRAGMPPQALTEANGSTSIQRCPTCRLKFWGAAASVRAFVGDGPCSSAGSAGVSHPADDGTSAIAAAAASGGTTSTRRGSRKCTKCGGPLVSTVVTAESDGDQQQQQQQQHVISFMPPDMESRLAERMAQADGGCLLLGCGPGDRLDDKLQRLLEQHYHHRFDHSFDVQQCLPDAATKSPPTAPLLQVSARMVCVSGDCGVFLAQLTEQLGVTVPLPPRDLLAGLTRSSLLGRATSGLVVFSDDGCGS